MEGKEPKGSGNKQEVKKRFYNFCRRENFSGPLIAVNERTCCVQDTLYHGCRSLGIQDPDL